MDTSLTRKRLHDALKSADEIEHDVAEAEAARTRAHAALKRAKATYAATVADVKEMEASRDALHATAQRLRRSLRTMAGFPAELLSMIVTACVADRDEDDNLAIDWDAALAPFHAASVNRHWRQAVLSSAECWTYIAVPPVKKVSPRRFAAAVTHLDGALSRSHALQLDFVISIDWNVKQIRDVSVVSAEHNLYLHVFRSVMASSRRLRTLSMATGSVSSAWQKSLDNLGHPSIVEQMLALLRCPTPQLVRLSVNCGHTSYMDKGVFFLGFPDEEFPLLLPDAPKLQSIDVLGAPIVCRRPHPGLPALRSLTLNCPKMYTGLVWDTLAAAPHLDVLSLSYATLRSPNEQPPASLPIRSLRVDDEADISTHHIDLPNLQSLNLMSWRLMDHVTESMARTVTEIEVEGYLCLAELRVYRELKAIEHFVVRGDLMNIAEDDAFFDMLCDPTDPLWPNLRHLELWTLEGDSVERDGLLRLVKARNVCGSGTREQGAPRPLEKVEFDTMSVPGWIAVQVKEILGKKCICEL